jgi:hypothetical protein
LQPGEGAVVESDLHLRQRQLRAQRLVRAPKAHLLRHNAAMPAQAQAGELEIEAARAQLLQQRAFGEVRQADLVKVNQDDEQPKDQQPDGDAEPSKADSTDAPEVAVLPGRHIQELGGKGR